MERLMTVDDVALVMSMSRHSIYARVARGAFCPHLKIGQSLRWRPADLEKWLNDITLREVG